MNIISGLCGLALLASTSMPTTPMKTEASVGVEEATKESIEMDYLDLEGYTSIDYTFRNDTKEITDIALRLQYRIPKEIYSTFLESDPETIFGVGIFLVDKNLSSDSYDRRGIYEKGFDEVFTEELATKTFMTLKCSKEDVGYIGEDGKAIDSKYASYIQYAKKFINMLGENEDREVAYFGFVEYLGKTLVTSSQIVSVRSVAEEYVKNGKTAYGEEIPDEGIEALCLHFNLERPWHQNFFKILFSSPKNWKTLQWITASITAVFLILALIALFGKKR